MVLKNRTKYVGFDIFFCKVSSGFQNITKGGDTMKFNHSKLLGRMRECGFTQEQLAKAIGISKATLNAKLNNQFYFTAKEMYDICDVLSIPMDEIADYFFAL